MPPVRRAAGRRGIPRRLERRLLGTLPPRFRLEDVAPRGRCSRCDSDVPVWKRMPSAATGAPSQRRRFCYRKIALTPLLIPLGPPVLEALLEMPAPLEVALLEDPGVAALRVRQHFPRVVVRVPKKEAVGAVPLARLGEVVQAPLARLLLA